MLMNSSVLAIRGCGTLRPLGPSQILYMSLNAIYNIPSDPNYTTPRLYNAFPVDQNILVLIQPDNMTMTLVMHHSLGMVCHITEVISACMWWGPHKGSTLGSGSTW